MGVVRLEITRREPVGRRDIQAGRRSRGAYEKIDGRAALLRRTRRRGERADRGPGARAPQRARARRVLRRLLSAPAGRRRAAAGACSSTCPTAGARSRSACSTARPRSNDPASEEDFGNGFLMRHGYTVAWIGWQPDVPRRDGMMAMTVPRRVGRPISERGALRVPAERARGDAAAGRPLPHPASGGRPRRSGGGAARARARRRARGGRAARGLALPGRDARSRSTAGSSPASIYDCVLPRAGPAGGRPRLHSPCATPPRSCAGAPPTDGNPCAGDHRARVRVRRLAERALPAPPALPGPRTRTRPGAWSSTGDPHVAGARRGEFNSRFGQPSLNAVHAVGSLFPFTDDAQDDPVTGERDALLGRLAARGSSPKIFTINTSAEYWRGDASLVHTDVGGTRDVEPRPHTCARTSSRGPSTRPARCRRPPPIPTPAAGACTRSASWTTRRSCAPRWSNLDRWVTEGVEPPPSAVPRLADGTAVPAETTRGAFTRHSRRALPRPRPAAPAARLRPGRRARASRTPAAQARRALRDVRLRGGRRRQRAARASGRPSCGCRWPPSRAGTRAIRSRAPRATSWP